MHAVIVANGYSISDERGRIDMGFVLASLQQAYWAQGRAPALTERSFAHCLPFGIYAPDRSPVGFARLLTDYTFRAHLGDVFIDPKARGLGLGRALVATILGHPELVSVMNWTLKTRDAHGLYAKFGFRSNAADPNWMTLDRKA